MLQEHSHDAAKKGYIEVFDRNWSRTDAKGIDGRASATKTMNTHIHVMEGFTNLYFAWTDPEVKTAILELLDILPSAEMLQQMDKFAWFRIWTGFTSDRYNTLDDLKAVFTLPKVINYRDRAPHNR